MVINIRKTILEKSPNFEKKIGGKQLIQLLEKLAHQDDINQFILENQHLKGFAFLDKALEHFNFSYQIDNRSYNHIPSEGRVIIVSNHPIGSLDGLALLKLIRSIRPDVRIVANELLNQVTPFQGLFLDVDNMSKKTSHKSQFKAMLQALENDEALIIFPAGEVSRIRPQGVRDGKWKTGFLKLAEKTQAPILPIYTDARNSALFYGLSTIYKPLGTLMLVKEMFNKQNQTIHFHVGNLIPWKSFQNSRFNYKQSAQLIRKHIYRLDKPQKARKKLPFKVEKTIAHPVDRKALKQALKAGELLGKTADGKVIYLFDYDSDSPVIREIGRLRELTFRTVEEGTGSALDLDPYDADYKHLVLWDEEDLEIVGAYRMGEAGKIIEKKGKKGLYTNTLFNLKEAFDPILPNALEMGRSFVQPRYWGKRSLDYLWYGIGAYINHHPNIQYMFGPVSLSDAYPHEAKELIIAFYLQQFGATQKLAEGKRPFKVSKTVKTLAESEFSGDYKEAYTKLNTLLSEYGIKVPTLFKQYAELCEPGGTQFIDFSIDPDFNNCVDGLIIVDLNQIKPKKRQRYLASSIS